MRIRMCINRSLFIIILLLIAGILTGMGFYAKWAFYDNPNHIKTAICNIEQCNITKGWCFFGGGNYTCYKFSLRYNTTIDNQTYTKIYRGGYDFSGKYPKVCKDDTVECFYDNRNIEETLSLSPLHTISGFLWVLVALFAAAIITCLVLIAFHLKLREEYVEIKDDVEINMKEKVIFRFRNERFTDQWTRR
jgi:hypothetical protein